MVVIGMLGGSGCRAFGGERWTFVMVDRLPKAYVGFGRATGCSTVGYVLVCILREVRKILFYIPYYWDAKIRFQYAEDWLSEY